MMTRPFEPNADPPGGRGGHVVSEELRSPAVCRHDHVEIAITIEIRGGDPARHDGLFEPAADQSGHVGELSPPIVLEKDRRLGKGHVRLDSLDVGLDMPVSEHEIREAVEIEVDKT